VAEANEVDQLLDQMLKGKTPEEILGKDGVLKGDHPCVGRCHRACKVPHLWALKVPHPFRPEEGRHGRERTL
jgi:hypothetical protein